MKRICVYCGSNTGKKTEYRQAADSMASELVERGIGLVYGGGSIGIMGAIADAMLARGGEAIGVIPKALDEKEVGHKNLTELFVVNSMHERKAMMADLSDGFVALPGGMGTLEEIFEVLTWAQLGIHAKPCGLLNVAGYYDHLEVFINHVTDEEFLKPVHRDMLIVDTSPKQLLNLMENYQPPSTQKWIGWGET